MSLRLAEVFPVEYMKEAASLFLVIPITGVVIFKVTGLYNLVIKYMGADAIWLLVKCVFVLVIIILLVDTIFDFPLLPKSVVIGFSLIAMFLMGGGRYIYKQYTSWMKAHYIHKSIVLIYGAGSAGVGLNRALSEDDTYCPYAFIDDDEALWGKTIRGLKVLPASQIKDIVREKNVSYILLAMPSVGQNRIKEILDLVEHLPVHVKILPSIDELVENNDYITQLREVQLEELLGRDPVDLAIRKINEGIQGKIVLITGAGGSIGSELCRQVLKSGPNKIILFELNEFALYKIEQSLLEISKQNGLEIPIYPLLGNVCDSVRVSEVIKTFSVQTIYHAAAYIHVPIVEYNVLQGINNNALGTHTLATEAKKHSVERFVLISTDKAVRPTNVMGATKRLSELILQNFALKTNKTIFTMVRFGNVLGSSGSVVPLFRSQIEAGGPVTVTHKDITRYFMTIPEAATLVLEAGSMGMGGDVFVLDMGEPVKIIHLAERMIHLTGYSVRNQITTQGIEIKITGLRPGEKLYEELLIGGDVIETSHPKILRAQEEMLPEGELEQLILLLKSCVSDGNSERGRNLLLENIPGYIPTSDFVDIVANGSRR